MTKRMKRKMNLGIYLKLNEVFIYYLIYRKNDFLVVYFELHSSLLKRNVRTK